MCGMVSHLVYKLTPCVEWGLLRKAHISYQRPHFMFTIAMSPRLLFIYPYIACVCQRTLFKVLVYTYCALNATAPNYLVQLINHRNVTRTLRSGSSTELLFVPTSRTVAHGDRCFAVASPILWNNLPVSLRTAKCLTQFRSHLKTHLFKVAFTLFYLDGCEHYDVTMTFSFRVLIIIFIPYIPCIS